MKQRNIYLSQSSIKDFISCNRRYYYRIFFPEESIKSDEMVIGEIVHAVLEKAGDDYIPAMQLASKLFQGSQLPDTKFSDIQNCITNYFSNFLVLTNKNDLVEQKFTIPYDKGVFLTGKFDRINRETNVVIDWKTGKEVSNLGKDVQSIIYDYSYFKLYGKYPRLMYVMLKEPKVLEYTPDSMYTDIMFHEIIPHMISSIRSGDFTRVGRFRNACFRCNFKGICDRELLSGN